MITRQFSARGILYVSIFSVLPVLAVRAAENTQPFFLKFENGKLVYGTDPQGNRIPDFSNCGYMGADLAIPNVPVRIVVSATEGDNTRQIQNALDEAASLPADANGFRGAVLLKKGEYRVSGGLQISASGVVLRGEGMGADGTVIIAAGTDRRTLLTIAGASDRKWLSDASLAVKDEYVPVGAREIHLDNTADLKAGDRICITRPSTQEWINAIGMERFGGGLKGMFAWKPGSRDIVWDRVITAVNADSITIDAPITTSLEAALGGAQVRTYAWPGRIRNVGVENLRFRCEYAAGNAKDENHAWMAITLDNAEDAWVRQFAAEHFAGSAVAIYETCKRITVENCLSLAPISEIGGYRRHTFFTMGQQTLFLRCWSEQGRHDFTAGHCAAGPNAFVQCHSLQSLNDSGPIESWACGVLYDNVRVDGSALRLCNRGSRGEGIGWAAANSVLWNCEAALIECDRPAGAWNWSFGSFAEFEGNGFWQDANSKASPNSLYARQLEERLGPEAAGRVRLLENNTNSTRAPSHELAAQLSAASRRPDPSLREYIEKNSSVPEALAVLLPTTERRPIVKAKQIAEEDKRIALSNGLLVCNGRLVIGGQGGVSWWRGSIRPDIAASFGYAITRFAPGRIGLGWTDDLEALTDMMIADGQTVTEHHYGLWYDRRREDHQRVRRMNGDVRPPFYEQPFARSGQGTAWDGLSRYDLTQYNPWYWGRLRQFADLCDRKGLVLLHQNYFQHNVIESGAHWVDFPWRPANNINQTGFPEPPFFAGDKVIYMEEQFYDTSHPARAPLHRAYIRKSLDNFAGSSNVIQSVSAEFTGPAQFVRFWLDTIAEWEDQTGNRPLVGLSCTKDVQDEILSDPKRSKIVSVIDIRQWWYQGDERLYAPEGGKHIAPRQHARLLRPRPTSFEQVVRAVQEYSQRYPDKAVLYSADERFGWAVLMGGGSIPKLPAGTDGELLKAVGSMQPVTLPEHTGYQCAIGRAGQEYLLYAGSGDSMQLDLMGVKTAFAVYDVDMKTGQAVQSNTTIQGGAVQRIELQKTPCLIWLRRQ
ncbi:MAG: glycoside hydrolase family 55 protein [Planctomycetaceae bacterium]|nr:glycoside hydrolase family 55 protein [Planctomycetaceae bacterium]